MDEMWKMNQRNWTSDPFLSIRDGTRAWFHARWSITNPTLCCISFSEHEVSHYWVKDLKDFRWPIGMVISLAYDFFSMEEMYDISRLEKALRAMDWQTEEEWMQK